MMVFVDGENLVYRYQDMVKEKTPQPNVIHEKNIFVWTPKAVDPGPHPINIIRASYYTYVVGDADKVSETTSKIKELTFPRHWESKLPEFLFPRIIKKEKSKKAKGVDIQLTVDILTHTYQNNLDVVYLISGDGDYLPVILEVMRNGKQVYLAALSSGLDPKLKDSVDKFINLDPIFFKKGG
jgi:uncharacterized LabA/DUF88 family protein